MIMKARNTGSGNGQNVGRLYTAGKKYKAGSILLDPSTAMWFEQREDGAFGYPSHDILNQTNYRLLSEIVPIEATFELVTTGADTPSFRIDLTEAGTYQIDWGDGSVTTETSGSNADHTYAGAGTYQIKIMLGMGQYPLRFFIWTAHLAYKSKDLNSLNRYNTIDYYYLGGHTAPAGTNKIVDYIRPGSKVDRLFCQDHGNLNDVAENAPNLYQLRVQPYYASTVDLDKLFITLPNLTIINLTSVFLDISLSTVPTFINLMQDVVIGGLTSNEQDLLLEGIATSVTAWTSAKRLSLVLYTTDIPGNDSFKSGGWIDQIEAQTGNPTVTVNT